MATRKKSSGFALSNAIRAQREQKGSLTREALQASLVKSSQWKKNALNKIDAGSADNLPDGIAALPDALRGSILETITQHWHELVSAAATTVREQVDRELNDAADAVAKARTEVADAAEREASIREEYETMRETLERQTAELKHANDRLLAQAETLKIRARKIEELEAARVNQVAELFELQAAYDQFQQQADLELNELREASDAQLQNYWDALIEAQAVADWQAASLQEKDDTIATIRAAAEVSRENTDPRIGTLRQRVSSLAGRHGDEQVLRYG